MQKKKKFNLYRKVKNYNQIREFFINLNKIKKGEKLFSLWWFLVLGLVGFAIVVGVLIFFSSGVDIRNIESLMLYDRIIDCLIFNGRIDQDFLKEGVDIFKKCNLNKEVINSGDFYFKINFFDLEGNLINEIREGSYSFEKDCEVSENVHAKNYPICNEIEENFVYVSNEHEMKLGRVVILTASNQKGRKIT